MSNARAAHLTRRGILAAGGALGLGAVLAACGDEDAKSSGTGSGKETAAAKSGPWSFKDDRGGWRLDHVFAAKEKKGTVTAARGEKIDNDELLERYLSAMTSGFDPHSDYMSPSTLDNNPFEGK